MKQFKKNDGAKDRIPDDLLKEIFPRKLDRSVASERVYKHLKKMILSGKLGNGKSLSLEGHEISNQKLNFRPGFLANMCNYFVVHFRIDRLEWIAKL